MSDELTLKDLKTCAMGTEIVGLPACIDKARSAYQDADNKWWQDVLLTDSTGQMPARILILDYVPGGGKASNRKPPTPWRTHQRIFIFEAVLEMADIRGKDAARLSITQCRDMAVSLTQDQYEDLSAAEGQDWLERRKEEVWGKCKTLAGCAYIRGFVSCKGFMPPLAADVCSCIDQWADYFTEKHNV